jgi:hypothetical protein
MGNTQTIEKIGANFALFNDVNEISMIGQTHARPRRLVITARVTFDAFA